MLGVCGSIAAYKAVGLCRALVAAGAEVTPLLTEDARRFVGPITFSALATHPVPDGLWSAADPVPHVDLGRWADVIVVAPATAHLLASYRAGLAPELLTATLLATTAPVVVAPAMHTEMWQHPATVENLEVLARRGVQVVGPATGVLAGGDEGPGRLAGTEAILEAVGAALGGTPLAGTRVLVTAGGTREPLDAVRALTNRSSGRQGHALAAEAARQGAAVTLVTAAEHLDLPGLDPGPGVEVVAVTTAAEMAEAVADRAPAVDVVVMAAAVADLRPRRVHDGKLSRAGGPLTVELEPTPDILAGLARTAGRRPVLVGFAAELGDPGPGAAAKLTAKGVDLVVGNDVTAPGSGFASATNAVTMVRADGSSRRVALAPKGEVARAVLAEVARLLANH